MDARVGRIELVEKVRNPAARVEQCVGTEGFEGDRPSHTVGAVREEALERVERFQHALLGKLSLAVASHVAKLGGRFGDLVIKPDELTGGESCHNLKHDIFNVLPQNYLVTLQLVARAIMDDVRRAFHPSKYGILEVDDGGEIGTPFVVNLEERDVMAVSFPRGGYF